MSALNSYFMVSSRPSLGQIVGGIALCEAVGVVGELFTASSLNGWYASLLKPPVAPPNWIFTPVWTILYVLMGVALAYLWAAPADAIGRKWALGWFWIGLALNLVWSGTFFGLHEPGAGYVIICVLWLAIVGLMWTGSRAARPTLWLLVPYFLWVTYASALNFGVLSLNVLRPEVQKMDADPANANSPLSDQAIRERNQRRADENAARAAAPQSPD